MIVSADSIDQLESLNQNRSFSDFVFDTVSISQKCSKRLEIGKEGIGGKLGLAVFPECVAAFCASQKLSRRLVGTSRLHLPYICSVISTFRAFDPDRGKSPKLLFLFADNSYKLLGTMLDNLSHFRRLDNLARFFFVSVLWADKNKRRLFSVLAFLWFQT